MSDTHVFVDRARGGDEESFTVLYEHLAPVLYSWADFRLVGRQRRYTDAEDVVQEVWWRALELFDTFEARVAGSFRHWLFAIANRVLLECVRRGPTVRGGRENAQIDSLPPELRHQVTSIATTLGRSDEVKRLIESINGLDEVDRDLVVYCGLEGLSPKEAAPLLGMSGEAAQKRWYRLRGKLRDQPVWADLA